jgi:hypothetical protein
MSSGGEKCIGGRGKKEEIVKEKGRKQKKKWDSN